MRQPNVKLHAIIILSLLTFVLLIAGARTALREDRVVRRIRSEIAADPTATRPRMKLGLMFYTDSRYSESREQFEILARLYQEKGIPQGMALHHIGLCYEAEGKPTEAQRYLKRALVEFDTTADKTAPYFARERPKFVADLKRVEESLRK